MLRQEERVLNAEEIGKHCTRGDAWVIVDGIVYDVSSFVERHPGGSDYLLANCGGDVSDAMRSNAIHMHSKAAFSILRGRKVGIVKTNEPEKTPSPTTAAANGHSPNGNGAVRGSLQPVTGRGTGKGVGKRLCSGNVATANGAATATPPPSMVEVLNDGTFSMDGWREKDLVDWSKPMLCQVGQLGSLYNKWVHSPVDKPLRLFHWDFVEFFSHTPWYVIPTLWLPVITLLSVLSTSSTQSLAGSGVEWMAPGVGLSQAHFAVLFVTGVLLWSLVEYMLHRFIFHLRPSERSPFMITVHFLLHGQHHKVPFETSRLVFPPVAAFIILSIFFVAFRLVLPLSTTHAVLAGGLLGYILYDLTHYYLHHGVPRRGSYFHRLKSYHVRHHFINHNAGFGISSKLWDLPFGTAL